MRKLAGFLAGSTMLQSGESMSHAGHGTWDNGLLHYLLEPDHLIGLVVVAMIVTVWRLRRNPS